MTRFIGGIDLEWKVPNDKPKECCIKILEGTDFIPGGALFECPKCHSRIDMLEANKYTIDGKKIENRGPIT